MGSVRPNLIGAIPIVVYVEENENLFEPFVVSPPVLSIPKGSGRALFLVSEHMVNSYRNLKFKVKCPCEAQAKGLSSSF